MIRLPAALLLLTFSMTISASAQTYPGDTPVPAGIEAQPLPAITPPPSTGAPTSLMAPPAPAGGTLAVTPHEGPEERVLDQSLGLPQAATMSPALSSPEVKPSAKEDAAIEARISAARVHGSAEPQKVRAPTVAQPTPPKIPAMPPTTIVGGSVSRPSNVAPAPTHWEGPEERALDQVDPLSGQVPIVSGTPSQDPETRQLNGGY